MPMSVKFIGDEAFSGSRIEKIYFEGDPPEFGENPFHLMNATIYYLKNNNKWDSIKKKYSEEKEIKWEEYEKKINAIIWVLIVFGIAVIVCAIILIIVINKKETSSSKNENDNKEPLVNE